MASRPAVREAADALLLGYNHYDYDKASRFTWKFLRDASAEQALTVITRILEADNKLTTTAILDRQFNPEERRKRGGCCPPTQPDTWLQRVSPLAIWS